MLCTQNNCFFVVKGIIGARRVTKSQAGARAAKRQGGGDLWVTSDQRKCSGHWTIVEGAINNTPHPPQPIRVTYNLQAQNRRTSRALLFLIELRQAKGVHADTHVERTN